MSDATVMTMFKVGDRIRQVNGEIDFLVADVKAVPYGSGQLIKTINPDGSPAAHDWVGSGFYEHVTELPYIVIEKRIFVKHYNPKYGDDKLCKCGHPYYRHFDTWDNMNPVGCKYCECCEFERGE